MDGLLSQLRDIRGLDAISWWPPAPGWWMVLGLVLVFAGIGLMLRRRRQAYLDSWRAVIREELDALRTDNNRNMKQKAAALSELLRRAAIKRYGRAACAGRKGGEWLGWLSEHDPAGFRWDQGAAILVEAPYMPDEKVAKIKNWDELLLAAERWTK